MLHQELTAAVALAGIQLLLVDQICPAGASVAEKLGVPFVTISNALPVNCEPAVPPYPTGWLPSNAPWTRWRNQIGNILLNWLTAPLWRGLQEQRQCWGLRRHRCREQSYSPLLQLAQLPPGFDFPRERLAPHFHYVGRLADPSGREPLLRDAVSFPWERLDGRPLIYASLGTLQNRRPELSAQIAAACAPLDAQLVISMGNPSAMPLDLPGQPLVVSYAPHQQLIARSALVITHAGFNTTLTAIGCGVALVAIPITNEQPGIAARVAYSGAECVIPLGQLDIHRLTVLVSEVLSNPTYRDKAQRLQADMEASGGVGGAVDRLEASFQTLGEDDIWPSP